MGNSDAMDDMEDDEADDAGVDMNVWEANDILESILEVGPYSLEYYLDCNHEEEDEDDDEEDEPKKKPRKKSDAGKDKKNRKGSKGNKKGDDLNIDPEGGDANNQECKQN